MSQTAAVSKRTRLPTRPEQQALISEKIFVLPFRGEFGVKLIKHVPAFHALQFPKKVAICEPGEEALFPSAYEKVICDSNVDSRRRYYVEADKAYLSSIRSILKIGKSAALFQITPTMPKRYFVPDPFVTGYDSVQADIVICPRFRRYGQEKNWPYWQSLAGWFLDDGKVKIFAAGSPTASVAELPVGCPTAWSSPRFLDASIAAIRSSRLVIATDSGLGHLAVWCGKPVLMISYADGRVAPGPVRNGAGRVVYDKYWRIDLEEYQRENHVGSPIVVLPNSWNNPQLVRKTAYRFLRRQRIWCCSTVER
jgi:Glycosyltransferase family 9 (heptosyltransferase)